MICFNSNMEVFKTSYDDDTQTDSIIPSPRKISSLKSTHTIKKFKQKQFIDKKQSTSFSHRSQTLYRQILEKQKDNTGNKNKSSYESFTSEENEVFAVLVKQIDPKFLKNTRYFPGRPFIMIKNRYNKKLKSPDMRMSNEMHRTHRKKQGMREKKSITQWNEERRVPRLVESSPLFSKAKVFIQKFFSALYSIISNCLEHL